LQDAPDDGFGRGGHTKGLGNLRGIGSIADHAHRLQSLDEPIRRASVALDQLGEAFGKNVSRTRGLWTDPFAHQ
jgi:hypothetical protein